LILAKAFASCIVKFSNLFAAVETTRLQDSLRLVYLILSRPKYWTTLFSRR